jgi:glycosyltransferase involved in cell wall biosynthesis
LIILVSSKIKKEDIGISLGKPEYSYFFLLKEFLPLFEKIGKTIVCNDKQDVIYHYNLNKDEKTKIVFISFTPPHDTPIDLPIPTICLFAWDYINFPLDENSREPIDNYKLVFDNLAGAIPTSSNTKKIIQSVSSDCPVEYIPTPVFNKFSKIKRAKTESEKTIKSLTFNGILIDSNTFKPKLIEIDHRPMPELKRLTQALFREWLKEIRLPINGQKIKTKNYKIKWTGVTYTCVITPNDHRKNWPLILTCFCWAFRMNPDAVLIIKITHHDPESYLFYLNERLAQAKPFKCRIIVVHSYLSEEELKSLISQSNYYLNVSSGEGLCIPLLEFMSAGVPAISTNHTAMEDYIDSENSFIIQSSLEPFSFPFDKSREMKTFRYRINSESLIKNLKLSYECFKIRKDTYYNMSKSAHKKMEDLLSDDLLKKRFVKFLEKIK